MSVVFSLNKRILKKFDSGISRDNGFFLEGNETATILLIHGLTGTPNEMRFLAKFFNKKMGYSVACPRLANHGEPLNILEKTTWQDCYQSVRNAFIETREKYAGPFFVSGLSMGALLSILLAREFNNEISGISCLSPTLFYDGWNTPWYRCFLPLLYLTPLKHFFYFREDPPYGIKNKALQERVHRYYSTATLSDNSGVAEYGYPFYPASLLHQLSLLVQYLKKILPDIQVPMQLIQAKNDDLTSTKNSAFLYDRVNSEIKEMVLLNNSYHVITADQERATVAQKMASFFTRITSEHK